jgi:hypothetical protein
MSDYRTPQKMPSAALDVIAIHHDRSSLWCWKRGVLLCGARFDHR